MRVKPGRSSDLTWCSPCGGTARQQLQETSSHGQFRSRMSGALRLTLEPRRGDEALSSVRTEESSSYCSRHVRAFSPFNFCQSASAPAPLQRVAAALELGGDWTTISPYDCPTRSIRPSVRANSRQAHAARDALRGHPECGCHGSHLIGRRDSARERACFHAALGSGVQRTI